MPYIDFIVIRVEVSRAEPGMMGQKFSAVVLHGHWGPAGQGDDEEVDDECPGDE